MSSAPTADFVLVPGFWLGGWAWDQVAGLLRDAGHRVTAVTLPGLQSAAASRAGVRLADHVAAVAAAIRQVGPGAVVVGHSGGGTVVNGAVDSVPRLVRRAVYVDSGPLPDGMALRPDLAPEVPDIPLPSWEELEKGGSSLQGLDQMAKATFRARAVSHPAGPARDPSRLSNPMRYRVPVTLVTSTFRAHDVVRLATEAHPFFAELTRLEVSYVDLPTGHWPMWSRPVELATALLGAAWT